MNKKTSPYPEWATKFRKPGTELRFIKNHFYLYSISYSWDAEKKRTKKVTGKLLGKITEKDGFIESDKHKIRKSTIFQNYSISLKEYGASNYIFNSNSDIIKKLQNYFPFFYIEIASMALFRLLHQSPIKNLQHFFEHSYLSVEFEKASLNQKNISEMLKCIGKNRSVVVDFMRSFNHYGEYILMDMTNVISKSKSIELAAKGYNSKRQYDPQVNLMFIYSSTINEPIYFRIVPGNVREVKAFELSIVESGIEDAILIADKGFYSTKNINDLDKSKLKYILPLRRNSSLVDYNPILQNSKKGMQSYLKFEDRYVWYYTNKTKNKNIICFLDDKLKVEEEADYLDRIASQPENYSFVEFESKMKTFGTIAMITNLVDYNPKDIYLAYKSRQKIEQMIDIMKNVVESDRTYMQDDDALQGWFFVNYISLLFYFRIYKFLVNENMLSKISPNDLLIYLSEIKKIKINNQWLLSEINSKISNILKKLNINIT